MFHVFYWPDNYDFSHFSLSSLMGSSTSVQFKKWSSTWIHKLLSTFVNGIGKKEKEWERDKGWVRRVRKRRRKTCKHRGKGRKPRGGGRKHKSTKGWGRTRERRGGIEPWLWHEDEAQDGWKAKMNVCEKEINSHRKRGRHKYRSINRKERVHVTEG